MVVQIAVQRVKRKGNHAAHHLVGLQKGVILRTVQPNTWYSSKMLLIERKYGDVEKQTNPNSKAVAQPGIWIKPTGLDSQLRAFTVI